MTLNQAAKGRIARLRKPAWPDGTYIRLHLIYGGGLGPWAQLYSCIENAHEEILIVEDTDPNWLEYTGPHVQKDTDG